MGRGLIERSRCDSCPAKPRKFAKVDVDGRRLQLCPDCYKILGALMRREKLQREIQAAQVKREAALAR